LDEPISTDKAKQIQMMKGHAFQFVDLGQVQTKAEQGLSSKTLPQKVITKPKPKSSTPAAGGC